MNSSFVGTYFLVDAFTTSHDGVGKVFPAGVKGRVEAAVGLDHYLVSTNHPDISGFKLRVVPAAFFAKSSVGITTENIVDLSSI